MINVGFFFVSAWYSPREDEGGGDGGDGIGERGAWFTCRSCLLAFVGRGGEGRGLISSDNMSLSDRCRNNKR